MCFSIAAVTGSIVVKTDGLQHMIEYSIISYNVI